MKSLIFLIFLLVIGFLPGCTIPGRGDVEYSDDAISLENFAIQTQVRPGRVIPMDFTVVNNVERPTEDVKIEISDAGGFEVTTVKCEDIGGSSVLGRNEGDYLDNDMGCIYDKIESLDSRDVHFTLRAKTSQELGNVDPYETEIKLSIEYEYNGETILIFPVLKYREQTERDMVIGQSYGPIHVDVKPSFLLEYKENGRTITEKDWATKDIAFDIQVFAEDVSSLGSSYEYLPLELDSFEIELEGVSVDEEYRDECDFDGDTFLTPKESVKIPMDTPLVCSLLPEEDPGRLTAKYDYKYNFEKIETIIITEEMF